VKAIYEPRGAALEYAPLAANLYSGCAHRCLYCYAPACLRKSREAFAADPRPREGILDALRHDAKALAASGRKGPVLLSFTSDPYQPCEEEYRVTRAAITILGEADLRMRVLTKNGALARRDFGIMRQYGVEFGVTLLLTEESWRQEWEPGAGTLAGRLDALREAHSLGIRTWVSIEPVLDPAQALGVIDQVLGIATTIKVGKLNHDAAREREIDWSRFAADVLDRFQGRRVNYLLKNALWRHVPPESAAKCKQTNIVQDW
jgi:DNA repair photolyase